LNVPDPKKVPPGFKFKKNSEVDAKDRTFRNMYQKVNYSQFSQNIRSASKSKGDSESTHKSMILPENNENMKIVDLKAIHSEVL